jgi:hypothetical protein
MAGHCPEKDEAMTKKDQKKHPREAKLANINERDWTSLFEQLSGVSDWALDIAAKLSLDYEEDLESIENVRDFVHGWLDGQRAEVPLTDLLTTISILFSAIELDLGIDSVSLLAPLRTMLDAPSTLPSMLRCPGAHQHGSPTVVIRRFPGRRNASAASTHLAA